MTSLALAPCFSALRFLFAIGKALNLVVTGIEARYRACAQLQPDELWRHSFSYGDNQTSYGEYPSSFGEYQIAYGENHEDFATNSGFSLPSPMSSGLATRRR